MKKTTLKLGYVAPQIQECMLSNLSVLCGSTAGENESFTEDEAYTW